VTQRNIDEPDCQDDGGFGVGRGYRDRVRSTRVRSGEDDAGDLSAALAAVPKEYSVDVANAESLADEIVTGAPLTVRTPTGDRTGVAIAEVSAGLPESVLSLDGNRQVVTRDDGTATVALPELLAR
jgi:hypothetical protein